MRTRSLLRGLVPRALSVRRKLTIVITATSGITLLLASSVFVGMRLLAFRSDMVRDLETVAQMVGDTSTAALTFGDREAAEQILSSLRAKPNVVRAAIFDRRGEVLARYSRPGAAASPLPAASPSEGSRFARDRLYLERDVVLDRERIGRVFLESDLERMSQLVRQYMRTSAVVLAFSLLVALLLSYRLQRVLSGPVLRLAEAARRVSVEKDYSVRVVKVSDDELGMATDAFNEMLAQIKARDEALWSAHDELEKRVEERTGQLLKEIDDRRLAEEALRQSEEQLRQSQKMEAIGRLAGGVAHDFNNLLTAILGYSQLMGARLDPRDPLRGHASEIEKAAERASGLTRQLLAFSRKQVLAPKVLDLNAVVSAMTGMLRRLIGEDVSFVAKPAPELGCVSADPGQIEQVLMNLVVNARDAMPDGGKLTVETADVVLDEPYARRHDGVTPGRYVMFSVSDTGVGMDAATRSRIFEPFFTTKGSGKGTGLGLSTVYGIVKQSGGTIHVYSEPGRGSTFKVYLPRVEKAAEALEARQATDSPRGTETILLVEDEDVVRDLAREILEMHGYTVLEAPHPGEAILICERHGGPIHLMVSDVVMPKLSGPDLHARVAPLRPGMKVLFTSGYTDGALTHDGVLSADMAFISKPFSPDALARKVREVLEQRGPQAAVVPASERTSLAAAREEAKS